MRDMILVERVTDGEFCSRDCQLLDGSEDIYSRYSAYCNHFGGERLATRIKDDAPYRCRTCLSTPSAVVLTAEMIEAVKRIPARRDRDGVTTSGIEADVDALRAAFHQVEGVGE